MADTLIKVDLSQSAYENDMIHNRWHPDIPMVATVKPGDEFIVECYDWTGGFIKNDESATDVRDIDLSIVHFLSGPIEIEGAEPGDLLVVDFLDIGAFPHNAWGFNGFFSKIISITWWFSVGFKAITASAQNFRTLVATGSTLTGTSLKTL